MSTRADVSIAFRRTHRLAGRITIDMELLMADMQALQNELDLLKQAVIDDEKADDANEAALNQTISDLKAQLAAGLDTQPIIDQLEAIRANLHAPIVPPSP